MEKDFGYIPTVYWPKLPIEPEEWIDGMGDFFDWSL